VLPIALADWDGSSAFTSGLDVANHLVDSIGTDRSVTVSVSQVDRFLASGDIFVKLPPSRMFLKIDVEGHDLEVLRGASALLTAHRPVIMVEVWEGGNQVRQHLEAFGYRFFRYGEESRVLLEYSRAFTGQANFIAIHSSDVPVVSTRLADSSAIAIAPPAILGWSVR
jgi:hypothetical protein